MSRCRRGHSTGKRQLADIEARSSDSGRGVQGGRRRRPQGAKSWRPRPLSDIRLVTHGSVRGPRRRRMIEGASTTSHA